MSTPGPVPQARLDVRPVRATVVRLGRRIEARFPDRDLRQVAGELVLIADAVTAEAADTKQRNRLVRLGSRLGVAVVALAVLAALYLTAVRVGVRSPVDSLAWLQLIESGINDLVFAGVAIYFLTALPARLQRVRLLGLLHRLRSLAHVIDMHQLTKDPERLRPDFAPTPESPHVGLDRDGLQHYLDYCSEMLSLVGKVAALCAETSTDPVVLDTVSTIETLTTGMSRKIWQKISLLPS